MGAHHFDIAKWAMDLDETIPSGVLPPLKGTSGLRMIYKNGVEFVHETTGDKFNDCIFYGTEGTLYVDRSGIDANPKIAITSPFGKDAWSLTDIGVSHRRNWLDCIRSRKKPVADVSYGAHTSMVCNMANIGYECRHELKWNPSTYSCSQKLGGTLANRPGRGQWKFI